MSTNKDRLSFARQQEFREPFVILKISVDRTVSHKKSTLGLRFCFLFFPFIGEWLVSHTTEKRLCILFALRANIIYL